METNGNECLRRMVEGRKIRAMNRASNQSEKTRSRGTSIQTSLLRNFVALILVSSATILLVTTLSARRSLRRVSELLIERKADLIASELTRFFEPATGALRLSAGWGKVGLLDAQETLDLNALYIPLMESLPQIVSVRVADLRGNEYLLERKDGLWRNRETRQGAGSAQWLTWPGEGLPPKVSMEDAIDPRKEVWFGGALAARQSQSPDWIASDVPTAIFWTEPRASEGEALSLLTASLVTPATAQGQVVVAIDLSLDRVTQLTIDLEVGDQGRAFVLTDDGAVVGLPREERYQSEQACCASILQPFGAINAPYITDGYTAWQDDGSSATTPYSFVCHGQRWWGGVRPFAVEGGSDFVIGVFLPEADLIGDLHRHQLYVSLISVGALAVACLMAVVLAGRYSRPLRELVRQSERLRELDTRVQPPVISGLREVNQLADAQESTRGALESFGRYVPTDVVRELLKQGEAARIGGERRALTVLFTDIDDFTSTTGEMTPEALSGHMAEYFEQALNILTEHGATIDKLIGDAVVAFWGAPRDRPDHALRAVAAAIDCRARLAELNRIWAEHDKPPLPTRFGLATGDVFVGNFGSPSRLNYTALGDAVNLASRIQNLSRLYGVDVLVSADTREAAGDAYCWRLVDEVVVKGRTEPTMLYEPVGRSAAVSSRERAFAQGYERAFRLYQRQDFHEAIQALRELGPDKQAEVSVARLHDVCLHASTADLPDDWSSVTRLDQK